MSNFTVLAPAFLRSLLLKYGLTGGIGIPAAARTYFEDVIPEMIRERRDAIARNVTRRDFLNVLITASEKATSEQDLTATGAVGEKNADDVHINAGAAELQQAAPIATDKQASALGRKFLKTSTATALSDDEIAAQCFIFMIAGFEATASTIGFLFHELAMNQDHQVNAV